MSSSPPPLIPSAVRRDRFAQLASTRVLAQGLLLGAACVSCGREGAATCEPCWQQLTSPPARRVDSTSAARLSPDLAIWAGGDYRRLRAVLLAHKERHALALAALLGTVLATALRAALRAVLSPTPGLPRGPALTPHGSGAAVCAVLVPAPSRAGQALRRGHDPLARVLRRARLQLRDGGYSCLEAPVLRHRRPVEDQSRLDRRARAANVSGSFGVVARPALPAGPIVIVDDVVTSGATLNEAARALSAVGRAPVAAAVVCAA